MWNGPLGYGLHLVIGLCNLNISVDHVPEEECEISCDSYSSQLTHHSTRSIFWLHSPSASKAWVLCFVHKCQASHHGSTEPNLPFLIMTELLDGERCWISYSLNTSNSWLKSVCSKLSTSYQRTATYCLFVHSWIELASLVLGVERATQSCRTQKCLLHRKHPITNLIVHFEYVRLLHAGPTLLVSSLSHWFCVICLQSMVRSITRPCITCRRLTIKSHNQMLGQLPFEHVTPGSVFEKVCVCVPMNSIFAWTDSNTI